MTKDSRTGQASRSRAAIAEEAAEWFVEWRGAPPSKAGKARFTEWLAESPVHVEEYLAIAQIYGALPNVDPGAVSDVEAFVDDTVIALHGSSAAMERRGDPVPVGDVSRSRRPWVGWGLAAGILVAVVSAGFFYIGAIRNATIEYTTGLGEQRSILLDDGSMVSLNTESGMEVAYTDEARWIKLTHGEALFDVEEDQNRPFWVETGAALIRVTGTQFNVYQQNGQTAVTVIEGTVEVAPRASPAAQVLGESNQTQPASTAGSAHSQGVAKLQVGDQAVVKSGSVAIAATKIDNLEPVTAWTDRRLVFSETPLSEIVAEFNRYNHRRLILDDATVATLEVSGVFSTHDPESLILFLERIADVDVEHSADGSEIHVRAADTTQ